MGNPNVARRHPDYPVSIGGTFAKRIQSIDLSKNTPTNTVDELGNQAHAGVEQDTPTYAGTIVAFPIDNTVENLFAESSGSTVTINMFTTIAGTDIKTPKLTYGKAVVIGVEYSCQAQQEWRATYRVKGNSWTEETNVISATPPSGVGAYKSKNVCVSVDGTPGVRVSGVTARGDIVSQDLYELCNEDPVGTNYDSPNITCDIDFYESDLIAGNIEPTLSVPKNIVITVGTSAQVITLINMVGGSKSVRGTVRGWGTRRYSYTSSGDTATGGMTMGGS